MFCKWCGKKIKNYSGACPFCGREQDALVNGNNFWDLCHLEPDSRNIKRDKVMPNAVNSARREEPIQTYPKQNTPNNQNIIPPKPARVNNPHPARNDTRNTVRVKTKQKKEKKVKVLLYVIITILSILLLEAIALFVFFVFLNPSDGQDKQVNNSTISITEPSTEQPTETTEYSIYENGDNSSEDNNENNSSENGGQSYIDDNGDESYDNDDQSSGDGDISYSPDKQNRNNVSNNFNTSSDNQNGDNS